MTERHFSSSRFIVGIALVVFALLLLLTPNDYSTAGAIALGVLGLITVAISRR